MTALFRFDRAAENTETTGTGGTITLDGAVAGYQTFASAGVPEGKTIRYWIEDGTDWERCTGVRTGTSLTRTTEASSNSDDPLDLSGSARVFVTPAGDDLVKWSDLGLFPITDFGADPQSDINTALQAAVDAAIANVGGTVIIPPGEWTLDTDTPIEIANAERVVISGYGAVVGLDGADNAFEFSACEDGCGIVGLSFFGEETMTAGTVIHVSGCERMTFRDLRAVGCYNGFYIEGTNVCVLDNIWFNGLTGTYGLTWFGTDAVRSDILSLRMVTLGCSATTDGIIWDGNCHSLSLDEVRIVTPKNGVRIIATQTSGDNAPHFLRSSGVEIDFPQELGVLIEEGEDFQFLKPYIHGSVSDYGLEIASGVENVSVIGGNITGHDAAGVRCEGIAKLIGVEITGNGGYGIEADGGSAYVSAIGCDLTGNSSGTTSATNGAVIALSTNRGIDRGPGLVLLNSGSVSNSSTLPIVLTSYTRFRGLRLLIYGVRPATNEVDLLLRFSTNGGSSYDSSGYAYAGILNNSDFAFEEMNSVSDSNIVLTINQSNTSTQCVNGHIELLNQSSTTFFPSCTWDLTGSNPSGHRLHFTGSGWRETAMDVDAIQLRFSSGNMAVGSWALYGYA